MISLALCCLDVCAPCRGLGATCTISSWQLPPSEHEQNATYTSAWLCSAHATLLGPQEQCVAQHGCTSQRVTKHVGARLGQPLAGGRTAPRPGHGRLRSNVLLNACPRETNLSSPGRTHLAPGACTPHRSRLAGHRSSQRPSVRAKRCAHQCRRLQRKHAHNREQNAQSGAVHVISRLRCCHKQRASVHRPSMRLAVTCEPPVRILLHARHDRGPTQHGGRPGR